MDASKVQPIKDLKPQYTQLFINNEFVNSKSGKTFATTNPATKQKIADVQVCFRWFILLCWFDSLDGLIVHMVLYEPS